MLSFRILSLLLVSLAAVTPAMAETVHENVIPPISQTGAATTTPHHTARGQAGHRDESREQRREARREERRDERQEARRDNQKEARRDHRQENRRNEKPGTRNDQQANAGPSVGRVYPLTH